MPPNTFTAVPTYKLGKFDDLMVECGFWVVVSRLIFLFALCIVNKKLYLAGKGVGTRERANIKAINVVYSITNVLACSSLFKKKIY